MTDHPGRLRTQRPPGTQKFSHYNCCSHLRTQGAAEEPRNLCTARPGHTSLALPSHTRASPPALAEGIAVLQLFFPRNSL